jgi:hypothetical protein
MKSRKNLQKEIKEVKDVYYFLMKNWLNDAHKGKIDFRVKHPSSITIYGKAFNVKNRLCSK